MNKLSVMGAGIYLCVMSVVTFGDSDVALVYQPCIACHGAAGQGNEALGAPAIAGQGEAYLQRQLMYFKSGVRGSQPEDIQGAQMKAMAVPLSVEEVSRIAKFLSDLPAAAATSEPAPSGDLKNGNNYYHAKCGACHGGKAEGNPKLNAPRLAGLDATYLKQQYQNFQQGLRGANPEDTYGRQMKMMSTTLPTDEDLDDVIAYIQMQ
jgi:cytochrome c553